MNDKTTPEYWRTWAAQQGQGRIFNSLRSTDGSRSNDTTLLSPDGRTVPLSDFPAEDHERILQLGLTALDMMKRDERYAEMGIVDPTDPNDAILKAAREELLRFL